MKQSKKIRVIALTVAGKRLAERVARVWPDCEISYKPKPFAKTVQYYFKSGDSLVFICATGIVVRTLAPVLVDKYQDPPVLVLDETGQFVIPLLSGHEGGANDLADKLADLLGASPVLTTAKPYLEPVYTVGMGCERHCSESVLEALLMESLNKAGLNIEHISALSSIDVKADEQGLIALAERLDKPFLCYSASELRQQEALLSSKSDYVFSVVGVYGVAESAALHSAQNLVQARENSLELKVATQAELVLEKQKNAQATCAIARCYVNRSNGV